MRVVRRGLALRVVRRLLAARYWRLLGVRRFGVVRRDVLERFGANELNAFLLPLLPFQTFGFAFLMFIELALYRTEYTVRPS